MSAERSPNKVKIFIVNKIYQYDLTPIFDILLCSRSIPLLNVILSCIISLTQLDTMTSKHLTLKVIYFNVEKLRHC